MTSRIFSRRESSAALLSCLIILAVPALAFNPGDLYLMSHGLPDGSGGSMYGIVGISPSGTNWLLYRSSSTLSTSFAYDPFRSLLVFAHPDSGIVGLDETGVATQLHDTAKPTTLAPRGDGVIYMQWGEEFFYLDAANVLNPLLDLAGTATFNLGGNATTMHYDEGTNSLILFAGHATFAPCTVAGTVCGARLPLTSSGFQVAGAPSGSTISVSTSAEQVVGSGLRDAGDYLLVVDTNDNGQEARMQLFDPDTLTFTTFASSGAYPGAAALSTGTYSNALASALVDDSFNDRIRAYAFGTSGSGVNFSDDASGWGVSTWGHSELARMVEVIPSTATASPDVALGRLRLLAPFPNPFNPRTTLRFRLREAGAVRLTIYDARGTRVRTLLDADRSAGWHEAAWDGRNAGDVRVASGVYFAELSSGGESEVQRLLLLQ